MFHKEVFILYGEKKSREEENSRTPNPSVCTQLRRRLQNFSNDVH